MQTRGVPAQLLGPPVTPIEPAIQDSLGIQHFLLERATCLVARTARQHYHSCIVSDLPERIPL